MYFKFLILLALFMLKTSILRSQILMNVHLVMIVVATKLVGIILEPTNVFALVLENFW